MSHPLKKLTLYAICGIALLSGCSKSTDPSGASPTPAGSGSPSASQGEDKAALNLRLAGGNKIGSDNVAFIGGGVSNKIWVADAKFHKLISMIDIGGPKLERTKKLYPDLHDAHAITFSKDFKTAYTVDWFNYDEPSQVIAFDPVTFNEKWRAPAGSGGHHSALSPDDKYLYVANQYGESISVIDTTTHTKVKDLPVGKGPDYITPSMYWDGKAIDSPYLWASIDQENKVVAIDWKTNTIVKEIPVDGMMHGINLTPDGKQVWVCVMGAKNITIIDVASMTVKDKITFPEAPIHLSFSPDGKNAYLTVGGSKNQIFKIETAPGYKQIWNSTGTSIPAHTGVSPDGSELWTLNHGMDTERYPYNIGGNTLSGVQIWNTENGKLVDEIPAEGMPHEIQFVPYSAVGALPPAASPSPEAGEAHSGHSDDPTAKAKAIYAKTCVACHATDLSGKDGPNLQKVGARLTRDQILSTVKNGKGMMPSGMVSDEEANLLADWLSTLK